MQLRQSPKNQAEGYALVTGASSGIGKAIALQLARRKINLILVALPGTGLEEVARELQSEPIDVQLFAADLTESDAARKLFEWVCDRRLNVQILVNNAGIGTSDPFETTSHALIETMLKLNNHALVMLTYYFLPMLKRCSPAFVLNVGSLASFMNIPGKVVYSATKSFIYSFSASLRLELKPHRVSVSCLCPGGTYTSNRVMENIQKMRYSNSMFFQTAEQVASEAVEKMFRGKKRIIPGLQNKFLFDLWSALPKMVVDYILLKLFCKKEVIEPKGIHPKMSAVHAVSAFSHR